MVCELKLFPGFMRQRRDILKRYPKSEEEVDAAIASLASNPMQGDAYPGFPLPVRKVRIKLDQYGIGASKGLRLNFLFLEIENIVAPLVIYRKGDFKSESAVKKLIREKLKEIASEIPEKKDT